MIRSVVCLGILLLAACSTVSRKDCEGLNAYRMGKAEAMSGAEHSEMPVMREGCALEGVSIDVDAWRRGRDEGLKIFCTEQNGFDWAAGGRVYRGPCPKDQAAGFLRGYERGVLKFHADEKVREQGLQRAQDAELQKWQLARCRFQSDCRDGESCTGKFVCPDGFACAFVDVCQEN